MMAKRTGTAEVAAGGTLVRSLALALCTVVAAMLLASGVALAQQVIVGTDAGETLNGTVNSDLIKAFGGNDIVNAKAAADELRGGYGADELYGENGNDTYYGSAGDDFISEYYGVTPKPITGEGYTGKDVMYGGPGADWLDGARYDDELHGGGNPSGVLVEERLFGQTGADKLYGEDGPDSLYGQQGSDLMSGGAGDDYIDANDGESTPVQDTILCGSGFDMVEVTGVDIIADASCEEVNIS